MDAEETEIRSPKRKLEEVDEDELPAKRQNSKVSMEIQDEPTNSALKCDNNNTPESTDYSNKLQNKNLEEYKHNSSDDLDTTESNSMQCSNFVNNKREQELNSIKQEPNEELNEETNEKPNDEPNEESTVKQQSNDESIIKQEPDLNLDDDKEPNEKPNEESIVNQQSNNESIIKQEPDLNLNDDEEPNEEPSEESTVKQQSNDESIIKQEPDLNLNNDADNATVQLESDQQKSQLESCSVEENKQESDLELNESFNETLDGEENDDNNIADPEPVQENLNMDVASVSNVDDSNQASTANGQNVPREKCRYGDQCYRQNPQHKAKFSHPGDADFDIPDNRPECPYGIRCYRKNPQHKLDYKHTRSKRKPKPPVNTTSPIDFSDLDDSHEEESVDESDYDPSFIDDESLEEFESDEDEKD